MLNKTILISGLWLLGSINTSCQELTEYQKERRKNLSIQFIKDKEYLKDIINKHLLRHKKCDLITVMEYIDTTSFLVGELPLNVDATVPDLKQRRIIYNAERYWDERKFTSVTIHEWFHLNRKCGRDVDVLLIKEKPVCRLFGLAQYTSYQITQAIEKELQKDFEDESIASSK